MSEFIKNIIDFVYKIFNSFKEAINNFITTNTTIAENINASIQNLNTFLDKNILNGELLNISLTYRELILYLIPLIIAVLFIIIMIKLILKLLNFVRLD